MSVSVAIAALTLLGFASVGQAQESPAVAKVAIPELGKSSCKDVSEQIGPCAVKFTVCAGFHKFHWRYHATACASGICASSGDTKSAKGAAEDAAKALFAKGPACAVPHAEAANAVVLSVPSVITVEQPEEAFEPLTVTTGGCKSTTEQVGPCSVQFSVCYGFYKFHWKYTATACASGVCGSSGHTDSAKGAAEDAAKALFAKGPACAVGEAAPPALKGKAKVLSVVSDPSQAESALLKDDGEEIMLGKSSCKDVSEQIGPCSVKFTVCAGFHKWHWRYHATACASGICASSGDTKSAKGAAEDAAKALFAKGPACAIPH